MELDDDSRDGLHLVRVHQPVQLDSQCHRQHLVSSTAAGGASQSTHPSKLNLPAFWISELAAWFAYAEAKFWTSSISSQRVMFDLLVAALSETTLAQVMDIINNIPVINHFEVLKLRLLEALVLFDQEKIDALFQLGHLGDHKPSQLLALMLSV